MIIDILKKDFKRKKTMNIILLLFVILATLFVSSSAYNIISIANGTDYFLDKAGIGDYVILSLGEGAKDGLQSALDGEEAVKSYRVEEAICGTEDFFKIKGKEMELHNISIMQCLEESELNYFDVNDEIVKSVPKGEVYVTSNTMKNNDLKVGDKIDITAGDVKLSLKVKGKLKDAFLGSSLMGNTRFLMSKEDYDKVAADPYLAQYYAGEVVYVDTDDVLAVEKAVSDLQVDFNGKRELVKQCYMMDMVIAGVLFVVSACLILVAFIVLKFTISFTMTEEFREIGVMKAIGISNFKIRSIYIVKYLAVAIIGSAVGFAGSIPFAKLLLSSVSENVVLGNDSGIAVMLISSIIVVGIIIGYSFFCTRKVKYYSPIDAIRNGQSGERFKKKAVVKLGKSKLKTGSYLAINDILSSPRRFITIIITFAICSLMVFMVVNTTETMESDSLVTSFGKKSDVYMEDGPRSFKAMSGEGKENSKEVIKELEGIMKENDMPAKVSYDAQFKYKVSFEGKEFTISCQQGQEIKADEYEYYEGTAPMNVNEVAITERVAKKIGAKMGDTITLNINGKDYDCVVTAYFQSMNILGEIIRIHEDIPAQMKESSGMLGFQFDFEDEPNSREIDKRIEKMKKIFDNDNIYNAEEYTANCIGVVPIMKSVQSFLLILTLIVVVLVTILMERSFISEEKGEIAILKAIGFSDASIMVWHMKRFAIVGIVSVLIAVAISVPMTSLCITPIFKMLGMKTISYKINPIKVVLIYPGIITAVTILVAGVTSRFTRRIKSADTASIE